MQAALSNAPVVIHLAGGAKGDDLAAGHLVSAALTTDVRHLILISVIGADIMPINYFRTKLAAEEAVKTSGVPYTIIRVAQVHDFVRGALGVLTKSPLIPVPSGLRLEPVSAETVAQELVARALGEPSQRVPDLAGPEILDAHQLVAHFQRARALNTWTVPVRLPGAAGRAYRRGDNLAGQPVQRRGETWKEYPESVFPQDVND
nr:NAD(P)H-binding protein [Arthrobacter sp. 260]